MKKDKEQGAVNSENGEWKIYKKFYQGVSRSFIFFNSLLPSASSAPWRELLRDLRPSASLRELLCDLRPFAPLREESADALNTMESLGIIN